MSLVPDLVFTLRSLRSHWRFSLAVIVILALGIGANTAIYSVVNAVVLSPLPYAAPDELVALPAEHRPNPIGTEVSAANFIDWRRDSESFESLGAYAPTVVNLSSGDTPDRLRTLLITPGGLSALGIDPLMGRLFAPEEEGADSRVAILSHGLWRSHFGGDADILNRSISLNDRSYPVVGVMPPGFYFPDREMQIYLPARIEAWETDRQARWMYALGRLNRGVSIDQAQQEIDGINQDLAVRYPEVNSGWGAQVISLHEHLVGKVRSALVLLLVTVFVVLLTACANIVNLQLARATSRKTEMAVRSALGASTSSLLRQLVLEGMILAAVAGAIGLILAQAGLSVLVAAGPSDLPRLGEVAIDGPVLLFNFGMAALMGIVFSLGPFLSVLKPDLVTDLREGAAATTASGRSLAFRRLLTIAEVVAAVVLTIGAALLLASLVRLQNTDPGFEAANAITIEIVLPASRYPEASDRASFFREVIDRTAELPGVAAVGGISTLPLSGSDATTSYWVADQVPPESDLPEAGLRGVTPGYLKAMGISLLRGRDFSALDDAEAPKAVLVNQAFSDLHWPGGDALGKTVLVSDEQLPHRVIGVVGDIHHKQLDIPTSPEVYVSYDQQTPWNNAYLVVRTTGDAGNLGNQVRRLVQEIDPRQPVSDLETLDHVVAESVSKPKFYSLLLGSFAALAFALAAIGIYSIISYSVAQRQHEIGIRVALGASRRRVLALVVREGAVLAAIGIAVGLAVAWMAAKGLAGFLFEVRPDEPWIFLAVAAALGAVATLASLLPALRASRVSPTIAFRMEG